MIGHRFSLSAAMLLCLAFAGCSGGQTACTPDSQTQVATSGGCLLIRTFAPASAGPTPVLFVVLHGDGSVPGPNTYHYPVARQLAAAGPRGAVAVAIIRPGYTDDDGRASDGSANGHRDNYTPTNIAMVADAITALKASYQAARVVGVGHSGGAAVLGDILGKYPHLLDAAVMVSCPCDLARWRGAKGGAWPNSLSPSSLVALVPRDAHVALVSGTRDINTGPNLSIDYVAALNARGVDATFISVAGADHNGTFRAPQVVDAAVRLASE